MKRKNVLITGATGGIGKSITTLLSKNYNLLLVSGPSSILGESGIKTSQEYINCFRCDLSKREEITYLTSTIKKQYKHIDWIIHSAGYIYKHEASLGLSATEIERVFIINTISFMQIVAELVDILSIRGGLIGISSTASIFGNPQYPVYSASKAALNTFIISCSKRVTDTKHTWISVCPGPTNTKMREKIADDAILCQQPEVIAEVVAEILSGSSPYQNGDIVVVRNGTHLKM